MECAVKEKSRMFQQCIVEAERKYASHCWRKASPLIRYAMQTARTNAEQCQSLSKAREELCEKKKERKGSGRVWDNMERRG